jgi:hypothetical protein
LNYQYILKEEIKDRKVKQFLSMGGYQWEEEHKWKG